VRCEGVVLGGESGRDCVRLWVWVLTLWSNVVFGLKACGRYALFVVAVSVEVRREVEIGGWICLVETKESRLCWLL
jgi:hypothetical protein